MCVIGLDSHHLYSSSNVKGNAGPIGGIVGTHGSGNIKHSFAAGSITSEGRNVSGVGGFVGNCTGGMIYENSYSTGTVKGNGNIGGFIGTIGNSPSINNCYTTSKVIGTPKVGGFIAYRESGGCNISNSYWSKETSEVDTSLYGTELTLEEMKKQESYEGWDFESGTVWKMEEFPELVFDFDIEE